MKKLFIIVGIALLPTFGFIGCGDVASTDTTTETTNDDTVTDTHTINESDTLCVE